MCVQRSQKGNFENVRASGAGTQSTTSSSSGTPGWLVAAIVVPIAVLMAAVAALATLIIRKRQPDRRKQAQDPDLLKVRGAGILSRGAVLATSLHQLESCGDARFHEGVR